LSALLVGCNIGFEERAIQPPDDGDAADIETPDAPMDTDMVDAPGDMEPELNDVLGDMSDTCPTTIPDTPQTIGLSALGNVFWVVPTSVVLEPDNIANSLALWRSTDNTVAGYVARVPGSDTPWALYRQLSAALDRDGATPSPLGYKEYTVEGLGHVGEATFLISHNGANRLGERRRRMLEDMTGFSIPFDGPGRDDTSTQVYWG